jgi:hypothetical protein
MKTNVFSTICAVISTMGAIVLVGGCASTEVPDQKPLLSAAGFRTATPQTAQQHQTYAALPSYKVQRAVVDDKVFYVYKDEKQGLAYIGGESEYQRYQQLAIQKHIANDYYQAAQLNNQSAMGWYGAWGPRTYWW